MDKWPLFDAFETFLRKGISEVKAAYKQKKWLVLGSYFLIVLILLAVSISGFINIVGGAISKTQELLPDKPAPYTYPVRTLTYEMLNKVKDDDGLYHTTFLLHIQIRAGDSRDQVTLKNNIPTEGACGLKYLGRESEVKGGLASTTEHFLEVCTTRIPIIDNGELFFVVE